MASLSFALKIVIALVAAAVCSLPVCNVWFRSFNTFFHESFHALTALVLGNKVKEISIDRSTEGTCKSLSKSKFKSLLVSLSGYTLCSLLPLGFLFVSRHDASRICFLALTIYALVLLILYIRNTYGCVWTLVFGLVNLALYLVPLSATVSAVILYIYVCLCVIGNTISCLDVLIVALTHPKQSGDCAILAKTTHIPAFCWAVLFNAVNVWAVYRLVWAIFLPL